MASSLVLDAAKVIVAGKGKLLLVSVDILMSAEVVTIA